MKQFVGKVHTSKVPFMDGEVEIKKLTVGDVKAIEAKTKEIQAREEEDQDQLEILRFVMRRSVVGAEDLTDEEFEGFPISELTSLSEKVMGIAPAEKEGNV